MTCRVITLLVVLFFQSESSQGEVMITVPPVSRVVPANGFAFFECNTTAESNHWLIDGIEIESDLYSFQPYSISINISVQDFPVNIMGTSMLTCVADGYQTNSQNVHGTATLKVLKDPPVSPNPTYRFVNSSTIVVIWSPPFLWSDYGQLIYEEYHVSFAESSGEVVGNGTVHATTIDSLVQLEYTFSDSFRYSRSSCPEVIVRMFATSQGRGNTQPIAFNALLPTASTGEFNSLAIQSIVYFHPNGLPAVFIAFELPFVCSFQTIEYTVTLRDSNNGNEVLQVGPLEHVGPGNITERITSGLLSGKNYSAQITAISVSGSSTSLHFISTYRSGLDCTTPTGSTITTNLIDIKLIVATAVSGALTVVLIMAMIVICACCIWKSRTQRIETCRTPLTSMVNNPIYDDGPMYETVSQGYTPTNSPVTSTPCETPSLLSQSDSLMRYSEGPSNSLPNPTPPVSLDRSAPRRVSQLAVNSFRSASVSGHTTCKPPGRERNKLCLTLSLSSSQPPLSEYANVEAKRDKKDVAGTHTTVSTDQFVPQPVEGNYIVMSPVVTRGFGSSLNGGWGEVNPELI